MINDAGSGPGGERKGRRWAWRGGARPRGRGVWTVGHGADSVAQGLPGVPEDLARVIYLSLLKKSYLLKFI